MKSSSFITNRLVNSVSMSFHIGQNDLTEKDLHRLTAVQDDKPPHNNILKGTFCLNEDDVAVVTEIEVEPVSD
jgi:hypothetical protein